MSPALQQAFAEAGALLSEGRWDEVEDLCKRLASRGESHPVVFALLGVVFAKRGNVEMAHGILAEACQPGRGSEGPSLACRCIGEFLGREQAAVLLRGLARVFPGEGSFAAPGPQESSRAPGDIGAWPYMNEVEVTSMLAALGTLAGPVAALEWGGGHSTFFYARRLAAGSVWDSIEHDAAWFARLRKEPQPSEGARIGLHLVPNSGPFQDGVDDGDIRSFPEYIGSGRSIGSSFRFVLVDGRARVECLREGWRLLERDGIMVLHDAERPEYRPGHPQDAFRLEVANPSLRERKSILFFTRTVEAFRALSRALREALPAYVDLTPGIPGSA